MQNTAGEGILLFCTTDGLMCGVRADLRGERGTPSLA